MQTSTRSRTGTATETPDRKADATCLLDVRDLCVSFGDLPIVNGVSFTLHEGEVVGIVGESGSGKSVSSLAIMRLLPRQARITASRLEFMGEDLLSASERRYEELRGAAISMIFQEPMTALNPVLTVGEQIVETVRRHEGVSRRIARQRALDALGRVGIPAAAQRLDDYPHQMSGGMRQRAMIAMALACNPRVLIADEPTTALDVTIQAQILELLQDLQEEFRMGTVMITHDLGVVSSFTDRVMIMYAGQVVEDAPAQNVFSGPRHPYTEGLLASIPSSEEDTERLYAIPGTVPPPFDLPPGCRFEPRCSDARPPCRTARPRLIACGEDHMAACIRNTGYTFPEDMNGGR
ncbi:ABC transporter ATP-binding protein [Nitratireductor pacificus]|uniref:ABC di/oligopeptide transporter, ATPase subunit n=1 Tax=Nitratireductor pacificus pht-3B TaxID=391937 RepID=K2N376_9HYPH|nr:ABC transporter ATP-binding protein [Nitratireductor pacificus]EKF18633.1 ABC di/oligopeptide transporter, ATPase subunit [Nitratireductor pacificus pht-3B]